MAEPRVAARGATTGEAMRALIQRLRNGLPHTGGELTDERLLDDFVERRAEDAFAAIVRRHGPMVRGVCRRVLRNDADADDAKAFADMGEAFKGVNLRYSSPEKYLASSAALTKAAAAEGK